MLAGGSTRSEPDSAMNEPFVNTLYDREVSIPFGSQFECMFSEGFIFFPTKSALLVALFVLTSSQQHYQFKVLDAERGPDSN
jgi:hypothetical protein